MAYIKTIWENLPSENTPINASNLNKIEEGIYNNSLKADQVGDITNLETDIKTNIVSAINEIKNREIYSTDEIKTNKVWINGKPIYRKVFIKTWGAVSVSELNIDTMIDISGMVSYSNGWHPLNAYANANFNSLIQYSSTEKQIQPYGNGYNNSQIILIIEYTKTTD